MASERTKRQAQNDYWNAVNRAQILWQARREAEEALDSAKEEASEIVRKALERYNEADAKYKPAQEEAHRLGREYERIEPIGFVAG